MNVLDTCKYEEDRIKNRGARVFTTLYVNFSDAQGQITLESVVVSGRNLNSSKLSCMSSLPARMRMIESKMKELECSQEPFPHPNDGSVKISLQLAHWLLRYSTLKMSTDRHTDRRRLDRYTISSP